MTTGDVFLLWHIHRTDEEDYADEKLIGVYSTEALARDAATRLASQPGFIDFPLVLADEDDGPGGFLVVRYTLDEDNWVEGYVTLTADETQ